MTVWRGSIGGTTPIGRWDTYIHLSSSTATIGFAFSQLLNFGGALWEGDGVTSFGLRSRVGANVALTRYEMWELDPFTGKATSHISASENDPGVGTNPVGPIQSCAVCEMRTEFPDVPYLGRMHTPPLVNSDYVDGRIKATSLVALRDDFQYAFSNLHGTGVTAVLYSRKARRSAPVSRFFIPDLPGVLTRRSDKYRSISQAGTIAP